MALANLIKIPLYGATIAAINLVIALVLLISTSAYRRRGIPGIEPPDHGPNLRYLLAIYILFVFAFIVRVASVAKFPAPILHDPVADAVWTKSLIENHAVTYFYSPGLHLVTAFFSKAASLSIPHSLNLVTNSFNAFSVLSWGLVTLLVTRRGLLALLVAMITFIVPAPSMLYVTSGKNSLIMAIAFTPLVFDSLYRYYKDDGWFNSFMIFVSLAALFLIHYPTFGYVFLTLISIMAFTSLSFMSRVEKFKKYRTAMSAWGMAGLTILFLVAWFALQHKGLAENNSVSQPINYSQTFSVSLSELKKAASDVYSEFSAFARTYTHFFIPIFATSILYFLGIKRGRYWLFAALFTFWIIAVPFTIRFLQLARFGIIESSGILLFFQAFTLIVALSIYSISTHIKDEAWSRYFYTCIALLLIGWFTYYQFHNFRTKTSELEAVDSYNLASYKWINDNHINGNFLIDEQASSRGVFFPTNGGMWLPVYTGARVSDNFADLHQPYDKNFYNLYSSLRNNDSVKESIASITNKGYRYYYYDSRSIFGPPINPENIKPYSKLIYSNPEISIYKFN